MKTVSRISKCAILFLVIILAKSFATDKLFSQSFISQVSNLRIVRYETPKFKEFTLAGQLVGFAFGGAIGSEIAMKANAAKTSTDFGEIVMYSFAERAQKEIPNWPKMSIDSIPVKSSYMINSGTLLVFEIKVLLLHSKGGFMSTSNIKMVQPDGKILWKKHFLYQGNKYGRYHSPKEFKENNCKLLIEEIGYAADVTVSEFINDLKNAK